MATIEVRFLIPLREDTSLGQGELHPPFRWKALHQKLEAHFGGYTRRRASVEGVWIEPGTKRRVEDLSKEYLVDVEESKLNVLRQIIAESCDDFLQQCIRVVIRGEVEYLTRREQP